MRFIVTAIFLLGASAAAVPALESRDVESWGLIAKSPGDSASAGIPIVLGPSYDNAGNTYLSTGSANETNLRFELVPMQDRSGANITAAKVLDHPGIDTDIYMWQTFAAKQLVYGIYIEITGKGGSWGFQKDEYSDDMLLSLNGDTKAKAAWLPDSNSYMIEFGSDLPPGEVARAGFDIVLVGVKY